MSASQAGPAGNLGLVRSRLPRGVIEQRLETRCKFVGRSRLKEAVYVEGILVMGSAGGMLPIGELVQLRRY